MNRFTARAQSLGITPLLVLRCYESDRARCLNTVRVPLSESASLVMDDIRLHAVATVEATPHGSEGLALTVTFTAETSCAPVTVGIDFDIAPWSRANYVLIPGAAYNGNRFTVRADSYPPMFSDPADISSVVEGKPHHLPTTITDVPRLNIAEGPSRLQLLARDAVTPAIGYFDPVTESGVFLLTEERTEAGAAGLYITESDDTERTAAILSLAAPGVREGLRYRGNKIQAVSEDRGTSLEPGDTITLRVHLYGFPCADIPALFDRFCEVRKNLTGESTLAMDLPWGAAWKIQEEKFNRDNWCDLGTEDTASPRGYYKVGTVDDIYQDFQPGWVGGAMSTLPLLMHGDARSQARAKATLDWLFSEGQAESGYFKSVGYRGDWLDDSFGKAPEGERFHLVRKSADALYFVLKHLDVLQKRGEPIADAWEQGACRCADALTRTFEQSHQWGQFVDERTGEMRIGGSAAAGIAPAALTYAARWFKDTRYQQTAVASARYLYENFTRIGITTGGPGEILQCPDSESAYGLLESFVVLYEVTEEAEWLACAEDAAKQCASWHVSYDYEYAPSSEFARLGLKSGGAVMANVQNKHAAPGICTLSGDALWKLFRWTANPFYLRLLQETARNLSQYLSRPDRPIHAKNGEVLPPGFINERVNLSDWDNNLGGVFNGSTWAETSLMLTFAEVPGVYVQPDRGLCVALDHVEANLIGTASDYGEATLQLHNRTRYDTTVSVVCETQNAAKTSRVGQNELWNASHILMKSGETREITIPCTR